MQPNPPIIVVKVLQEVVKATSDKLLPTLKKAINYQPGRAPMILAEMLKLNDSIDMKAQKYPLFAVFFDFSGKMGTGYYSVTTIPTISIMTPTIMTDPMMKRYDTTFGPILYPIYAEFLRQLARHRNVVAGDPGAIPHSITERPGNKIMTNLNDVVDVLEISDLQLTLMQVNNCKKTLKS